MFRKKGGGKKKKKKEKKEGQDMMKKIPTSESGAGEFFLKILTDKSRYLMKNKNTDQWVKISDEKSNESILY